MQLLLSLIKKFEEKRYVKVEKLDNIIKREKIDKINFLKVDIEGYEKYAIKGMKKSLKITDYLMIEIKQENKNYVLKKILKNFELIDKRGENYFFKYRKDK